MPAEPITDYFVRCLCGRMIACELTRPWALECKKCGRRVLSPDDELPWDAPQRPLPWQHKETPYVPRKIRTNGTH